MRWWMKLLAAFLAVLLLVWLGWSIVGGITKLLGGVDLNGGEPDPMFAQEAEIPTRPPELDAEQAPASRPTLDDYAPTEGAPVDKTVDELIREAQLKQANT